MFVEEPWLRHNRLIYSIFALVSHKGNVPLLHRGNNGGSTPPWRTMKTIQVTIQIEVPDELVDDKGYFLDNLAFDIEYRMTRYMGTIGNNRYLEEHKFPIGHLGRIKGYPYKIIAAIA